MDSGKPVAAPLSEDAAQYLAKENKKEPYDNPKETQSGEAIESQTISLVNTLSEWETQHDSLDFLVYALGQQYTPKKFCLSRLTSVGLCIQNSPLLSSQRIHTHSRHKNAKGGLRAAYIALRRTLMQIRGIRWENEVKIELELFTKVCYCSRRLSAFCS